MRGPVLSIGETLIDLIASDGAASLEAVTSFAVRPGGAPANAAVALARLGVPSAFCGVVGQDPFGRRLFMVLEQNGVDVTRLRREPNTETTIAYAWKDERGDGQFRLLRMADRLLSSSDISAAAIDRCSAIVVGSVILAAEPARTALYRAVETAVDARVPVCFDVNMRPTAWPDRAAAVDACERVLQHATLLKLSLDDAAFLAGQPLVPADAFVMLDRYPARFRVLTDGARGAYIQSPRAGPNARVVHIPAFAVTNVDPTGAGDAFTAATIARLIGNSWTRLDEEDIRFASAAGALTTTRRGAIEALPTLAEIDAFIASR